MTKKALGQHWLVDEGSLDLICQAADLQPDDNLLEIGPGQGALTTKLLQAGAQVTAVELDDELVEPLRRQFSGKPVTIIQDNILRFDLTTLPAGYKVVANIPYYLTSKILRTLTESDNPFSEAVLLVQKEVAERVAAGKGKMSALSVATQLYCDVGLGPVISADKFMPPPKVDSQILLLNYTGLKHKVDVGQFFRVVHAGFGERRKKLTNSLSGGLRLSKTDVVNLLSEAGIRAEARAQELAVDDWVALYRAWQGRKTPALPGSS